MSELFRAVLCTTDVHNDTHTQCKQFLKLSVGFRFNFSFHHAMHFSAKRGIAIVIMSVCPSICLLRSCIVINVALQFVAHIRCSQTAGWTKMPLGVEVGLCPGNFVLDGTQFSLRKMAQPPPNFRPMSIVAKRLDG